jgi:hypothetical protein
MVEVTKDWNNVHNEDLNDFFPPSNIVRVVKSTRMRRPGTFNTCGIMKKYVNSLVSEPEGKTSLGRHLHIKT